MAPGLKTYTLILLIIALSGAMIPATAQLRDRTRPERSERSSRPEEPTRNPENDRADRTSVPVRSGDGERSGHPVTVPNPPKPVASEPAIVILPVVVPLFGPLQLPYPFVDESQEEYTENSHDADAVVYSDGWNSRWKLGYAAGITSYGFGGHLVIPAGTGGNSEVFIKLGIIAFSRSQDLIVDGNVYESNSGLFPLALMVKTTHLSGSNTHGEYRLYTTFGGGPVIGFTLPADFDEGNTGISPRLGIAGEFFGSLGAEFVLNGTVSYYAEAGLSYINFAGQSFSTAQKILSPTLSIGVRFY